MSLTLPVAPMLGLSFAPAAPGASGRSVLLAARVLSRRRMKKASEGSGLGRVW